MFIVDLWKPLELHDYLKNLVEQECIPVGCVPPAAVAVMGSLHPPWNRHPFQSRHPPEQAPLGQIPLNFPLVVGLDRSPSNSPLAVGLDQIPLNFTLGCGPGPDPLQLPPWVWAWRPPGDLLQGMLGYHLECILGYYTPPVDRMTDTCKNITFANFVCGR